VQKILIAEIHRTPIWSVVVTVDGNIRKADKKAFIDKDCSYITLVPDGNIQSLVAEIEGLALERGKLKKFWNSEPRFVVAGANEFSMSQQTDIFNYFSIIRIYKCIIVNQEHYVTDKEFGRLINFNAVDTSIKLVVYTWVPYRSSEICNEVNDFTLLATWFISAQGHFTKYTDLFPIKISNSLNRCPMKEAVRDGNWSITTKYVHYKDSNGNVVSYIKGLEYDLLKVVLKQMNMTFEHVPTPEDFERH
jgi:hypothetical protein